MGTVERRTNVCHACHPLRLGAGAGVPSCRVCGIDDQRMLASRRLSDGWTLLCANHAAILGDRWIGLEDLRLECELSRAAS
jgi:hypothetical protein